MKIKSLISILSAAVLAAALVGCSANPTASPVPAVNQNSPVTTDDATPHLPPPLTTLLLTTPPPRL